MKGLAVDNNNITNPSARGMSNNATVFVDQCVDVLLRALRSLSTYTRVAGENNSLSDFIYFHLYHLSLSIFFFKIVDVLNIFRS